MKAAAKKLNFKVFSLSSHPELTQQICKYLNIPESEIKLSTFSCGELYTRLLQNIRGDHIYLVQTSTENVNKDIMELLIAIDACKRASAASVNVVMPHFPYSRQDKKSDSREPITGRLIANLLEAAGANRLITLDLHAEQIQGFFNIPVDHMTSLPLFVDYFKEAIGDMTDVVVVAPDTGRAKAAKKFADRLGAHLAIIHKTRPEHNVSEVMHVIGDVKGKTTILYDDMVDTGGITPDILRIKELLTRIDREDIKEAFFAVNPTVEGEATIIYITKLLKPSGVKMTRIAYGLPIGADIDYADELTITKAYQGRVEI